MQWENSSGNEGKREMEGRKNRTDVEIEKEFWARRTWNMWGSLFIITVFRVLNVGKGRMLEIKIGMYRSKN